MKLSISNSGPVLVREVDSPFGLAEHVRERIEAATPLKVKLPDWPGSSDYLSMVDDSVRWLDDAVARKKNMTAREQTRAYRNFTW